MEVVLYNPKSDKIVIKKDEKNCKYSTLIVYEQNGYKFILCEPYFLNIFPATTEVNHKDFACIFFTVQVDMYMKNMSDDLDIDSKKLLIAIDEENNFYDGLEILESFKISQILAKR